MRKVIVLWLNVAFLILIGGHSIARVATTPYIFKSYNSTGIIALTVGTKAVNGRIVTINGSGSTWKLAINKNFQLLQQAVGLVDIKALTGDKRHYFS